MQTQTIHVQTNLLFIWLRETCTECVVFRVNIVYKLKNCWHYLTISISLAWNRKQNLGEHQTRKNESCHILIWSVREDAYGLDLLSDFDQSGSDDGHGSSGQYVKPMGVDPYGTERTCPPIFGLGGTITNAPPKYLSSDSRNLHRLRPCNIFLIYF